MSRRKRRREGVMPVTGAGLIRFFEEEVRGIKVSPIHVIIMAIALMAFAMLGNLGFLQFLR
ncbi:MAG: preprotein translocase subunit Sec61beta [archaeon GB-1867-005]|nr:preprotein translocase subunit Sec61beta [Candidatus Culexmicrobium cathedralense]